MAKLLLSFIKYSLLLGDQGLSPTPGTIPVNPSPRQLDYILLKKVILLIKNKGRYHKSFYSKIK